MGDSEIEIPPPLSTRGKRAVATSRSPTDASPPSEVESGQATTSWLVTLSELISLELFLTLHRGHSTSANHPTALAVVLSIASNTSLDSTEEPTTCCPCLGDSSPGDNATRNDAMPV